jgi:hypothetical protein
MGLHVQSCLKRLSVLRLWIAAVAIASIGMGCAQSQERGFWVVAGTLDQSSLADVEKLSARVEHCGYPTIRDVSSKFVGFTFGYTVIAVGPFSSQENAALALGRIRPCIADAYVKFAIMVDY